MLSCVLLGLLGGTTAFGSHLRGTSVSWQPTSTAGTVQFTIQYSQRTSAGGCTGSCVVGNTISVPFTFGDGNTGTVVATITSVNSADDYFSAVGTVNLAYSGVGPYTAAYYVSARVSSIKSGANDYLRMQTLVTPFASPVNHPPVAAMPAIITVPLQASVNFSVAATDQDGDTLAYRLSTSSEQYGLASSSCAARQPPGLTINNAGLVTWDTTQITQAGCSFTAPVAGDLWTVQFMVQDLDGSGNVKSKTPVDIILEFVNSTEAAPTLTFSSPGPFTINPGSTLTFTATGDDTAANSRVTVNATGLPLGATATNTNQSLIPTVASVFTWTPTLAQAGSYVVTFTATMTPSNRSSAPSP